MPGPNFGMLQPIVPTNRTVGALPAAPNSADQLGQGLLQGLQTGSNVAGQMQQRQQNAALFPSILQDAQNKAESSSLDLQTKKGQIQDEKELRAAAIAGPDQYAHLLQQKSPEAYQDYQLKMAKTQQAFQTLAKSQADTDKAVIGNYNQLMGIAAQITRAASAGSTPQMQQQIYQFGLSQAPKSLQTVMPAQYDANTGMAVSRLAHESTADQLAQNSLKNKPSPIMQMQQERDQVAQQIQQNQTDGKPADPMLQQKMQELTDGISKGQGKQAPNPFDTAIATNQAKQNTTIEGVAQQTDKLINDTQAGMQLLTKIPSGYTGPIAGRVGLGFENSDIQKLDKILAGIPLIQKSATLGQTAGARLFTSELEMMKKSSGTKNLNADALKWILQEQNTEAQVQKWKNWNIENANYKNASPNVQQNWHEAHPQPQEPRIEVVDPKGQHQTIPYTQMDAYLKATPGAQRW